MNIVVLDSDFIAIREIDVYISFIWTERYQTYGDFELYLLMDDTVLDYIKQDYYITIDESDRVMIIEEIEIITDVESGDKLKVTGRSLESILDRRIVWSTETYDNVKYGNVIYSLIKKNFINEYMPSDEQGKRNISNFTIRDLSNIPASFNDKIRAQYTGKNIYETIVDLCLICGGGYKVTLSDSGQFVFDLYEGTDRTNEELSTAGYVEFSPTFDNLISSDYLESKKTLRNVTKILGEDTGEERKSAIVGDTTGLDRRELYTDARDIQSEREDQSVIPEEEYIQMLEQRGSENLAENPEVVTFEANVDYAHEFIYGRDWFLGDIVKIRNAYGISASARITEIVRSVDENGYELYPTFEVI